VAGAVAFGAWYGWRRHLARKNVLRQTILWDLRDDSLRATRGRS